MRKSPWRAAAVACALQILGRFAANAQGATNDSAVHVPPLYDSLMPPVMGSSYVDPVFGTSVKRLSDARSMRDHLGHGGLTYVSTEYPTASPFNSNGTLLILQHEGYYGLYAAIAGVYIRDLPFAVNASSEPRWSRTEPTVLYYVKGHNLMKLDVGTQASSLVHAFAGYVFIRGRGESDISRDGDHFVFAATRLRPNRPAIIDRYIFVYELSTDTMGPVLDTAGHSYDQLYIAPDNSVLIGWLPSGTARFSGIELFDRNMNFQRQITHTIGHMHLTRDTNGDDLLVWNNSNDALPIDNCQNGIVKVRLADAQQTCLLQLDWSLAVHITAPDGNGWVFVETYAPSDPLPVPPFWKPYTNELLQVKLDGTETRRLVHHRSRPVNDYGYQPRASVSRDGQKLVFTSNFDLQHIVGAPIDNTDVYLLTPALARPKRGPVSGTLGR